MHPHLGFVVGVVRVYGDWERGVLVGVAVGEEWGRLEDLSCSVGMSCSMFSQTCRSWYFPRFCLTLGH